MNEGWAPGSEILVHEDEEKVIPWAEGNGLWGTLTELVSDLIVADLLTFLVRNPYTFDSVAGLAQAAGRDPARIQPVLDRLVEVGLLQVIDLEGLYAYRLTEEPHWRQTLQQYVTWLQEGYHWVRLAMEHR